MNSDNPYSPPKSGLTPESSGDAQHRAWPWKLYFFAYTGLTLFSVPVLLADPAVGNVDFFSLVLSALFTVGLFGFVFSRAYLAPVFWRALLVVSLVFSVSYYFLTDIDLRMGMRTVEYWVTNAVAWLLVLPGYVALYLYGRSEDRVWRLTSRD